MRLVKPPLVTAGLLQDPGRRPHTHDRSLPPPSPPQPLAAAHLLSDRRLACSVCSPKWNRAVGGLLRLASFIWHVFEVCPHPTMYQYWSPVSGWTIVYCVDKLQCTYPLIRRWVPGLVTAVNTRVLSFA